MEVIRVGISGIWSVDRCWRRRLLRSYDKRYNNKTWRGKGADNSGTNNSRRQGDYPYILTGSCSSGSSPIEKKVLSYLVKSHRIYEMNLKIVSKTQMTSFIDDAKLSKPLFSTDILDCFTLLRNVANRGWYAITGNREASWYCLTFIEGYKKRHWHNRRYLTEENENVHQKSTPGRRKWRMNKRLLQKNDSQDEIRVRMRIEALQELETIQRIRFYET